MPRDLHELPKIRDALGYLYVEHAWIDQDAKSIALHRKTETGNEKVPIPAAALAVLMLGPGTSITHAAIRALSDNNCLVVWCGEECVRLYAAGTGGTRSAARLLHQIALVSQHELRMQVVVNMYRKRLGEVFDPGLSLEQVRGKEGIRVREAYAQASRRTGVPWSGRAYRRDQWAEADPVNRALSAANSCLYGLCHAAILATGYSPAVGFIHTGKDRSFVFDVADLYKGDLTIPVAFDAAAQGEKDIERRVRYLLRDRFREARLLDRIVPDIEEVLSVGVPGETPPPEDEGEDFDADAAKPGGLWDPSGTVSGGVQYGAEPPAGSADTTRE